MLIRESLSSELDEVMRVEGEAFGSDEEAKLSRDIINDPSSEPTLSLLAFVDNKAVGHILFSRVKIENTAKEVLGSILAPLAIVPEAQNQGIGGKLIKTGLGRLAEIGVELVFVLGHPGYYPRYGFKPAGKVGLQAPYPILEKDSDAWMVQELRPGLIGSVHGRVVCCNALDKPEHWRE